MTLTNKIYSQNFFFLSLDSGTSNLPGRLHGCELKIKDPTFCKLWHSVDTKVDNKELLAIWNMLVHNNTTTTNNNNNNTAVSFCQWC